MSRPNAVTIVGRQRVKPRHYGQWIWSGALAAGAIVIVATTGMSESSDSPAIIDEGKHTFRYDTFGDEGFWGDQLRLHHAVQGQTRDSEDRNTPLRALWSSDKVHKGGH